MLSHYLDRLEPALISFGVKQRRPKTVYEAVSSTIELESYMPKLPARNISQVGAEDGTTDRPELTSVQAVQQEMIGVMQKLVDRVEKLEAVA